MTEDNMCTLKLQCPSLRVSGQQQCEVNQAGGVNLEYQINSPLSPWNLSLAIRDDKEGSYIVEGQWP